MSVFTDSELEYLAGQRLGRIATVGADGQPHVVPTSVTTPSTTLST
jgi:pyridoxamine 5'-phosphate oxidase family protein